MIIKNLKSTIGRNVCFCLLCFLTILLFTCSPQATQVPENIQFLHHPVNLLFHPNLHRQSKQSLTHELQAYKTTIDTFGIQMKLEDPSRVIWATYFFTQEHLQTMNVSIVSSSQTMTLNIWQSILSYYDLRFHKAEVTLMEHFWYPDSASTIILELFPSTNEIKMAYLLKNTHEN